MKKSLLFLSLYFISVVLILHLIGETFYLYWYVVGYDKVVHFLSGLSLGFFTLWVLFVSGLFKKVRPTKIEALIATCVAALAVGVAWEVFEYANGLTQTIGSYQVDTVTDLIADLLGGVTAGFLGLKEKFYE